MTLLIRAVVPSRLTTRVVEAAESMPGTAGVVVFDHASVLPAGDVVEILCVRESVDKLLESLEGMDVAKVGSVSVSEPALVLADKVNEAERATPGEGADAIIWDEVEAHTGEDSKLSWSFLAFLVIALQLAGIGIVTNSTIAIVGAMVVGPEFGPLAGIALGLVNRRWVLAKRSAIALGVGFPVAMVVTAFAAWLSVPLGLLDRTFLQHGSPATDFIYHPGPYSLIVAMLAGAAGMLSLIGQKSAVLVGVFISVTTVPAAGYVAVALALGEPVKAAGSALQLVLNLAGIIISAVAVLVFYHLVTSKGHPGQATPAARRRRAAARRYRGR
ncbi:DUF389 domain-containing protein [Arthrobacter sp. H14-L1]|uniref:DUF389 domain-containing protein n=1 Tax=Arthrobacter sp. H14-L1 TaxID=2996697 RepID=UPI00226F0331|nr:DUF389 domain-containing protein [Arthrobacter sp. H14-L1]MCY0904398.1 DUF389 domain-containing protein [Arthrobacter sp. H14-L1]